MGLRRGLGGVGVISSAGISSQPSTRPWPTRKQEKQEKQENSKKKPEKIYRRREKQEIQYLLPWLAPLQPSSTAQRRRRRGAQEKLGELRRGLGEVRKSWG